MTDWTHVDNTLPPRAIDAYYGERYSVPVLIADGENHVIQGFWRYDFQGRGWVAADLDDGPDPTDYPDANLVQYDDEQDLEYIDPRDTVVAEWRSIPT